jgi:SOS response regulatory protein OraA/RecX
MKLLAQRDYSIAKLRDKLDAKFGETPEPVIQQLIAKRYLDDRRLAENYVSRHKDRGQNRLRDDLITRGIPEQLVEQVLSAIDWPSLSDALNAKMKVWHLRVPLQPRDAARLFRAMARLGYEEDAIREEIEQLTS